MEGTVRCAGRQPAKEGEMAEDQPPEAWIGRQVEANILNAAGYDEYGFPSSLTAHYRVGILEGVNNLGIVATLWFDPDDEAEEPPVSTFYPWSSVVWLKPEEET
jgi:hypothetical protein